MGTMVDPIRRGSFDNKDESAAHAATTTTGATNTSRRNSTSNSFAFLKDDYTKEEIDKIFLEDIFLQGNPELHFQPYEQRRFQGFSTMHNRARSFQHQSQPHLPEHSPSHSNSNSNATATTTANLNINLNLNLSSNHGPQSMQTEVVGNTVPSSSTFKTVKRASSGSSNSRKSKVVRKNNSAPMKVPSKVSNNKSNKNNKSTLKAKGKSAQANNKKSNVSTSKSTQSTGTPGRNQQLPNGFSSHQTAAKQELEHRQLQQLRQNQSTIQNTSQIQNHQIDFDFAANHFGGDRDMLAPGFPHYDNHRMHNSVKVAGDHLLPYQGIYRQQQQNQRLQQQLPLHTQQAPRNGRSLASIQKIYNPKKKKKKSDHEQQAPDTSKLHKPKIDLEAQSSIFKKRREKWSEDEMKTLWEAIITYGNNWTAVSKKVVTRNYFQIKDKGRRELCVRGWETGRKKTEGKEAMRQAQLIAKQELLKMTQS